VRLSFGRQARGAGIGALACLAASLLVAGTVLASTTTAAGSGAPTVSGPLSAAAGGGCQPSSGCAFDYALAPSATSDPSVSWHAFWITTAATSVQSGWCELDAITNLTWGISGPSGIVPTRTYPGAGTMMVGGATTASFLVDAGGAATTPGRLQAPGMPAGLITTWVHRGFMTSLWQGRASVDPSLVMAAELANPTVSGNSPPGRAADYNIGLPCDDFAPPGQTFLARWARSTIRLGQTGYLELRIPKTGLRTIITPKINEQTSIDGKATVQMIGSLGGGLTTRGKPQVQRFADRWTFEITPGFGAWSAIVTLQGPTGIRHYRLPLTVRA